MLMTGPYWFKQVDYVISKPTPVFSDAQASNSKIEPNTLIIERLGIKAPIIYATENKESVFQEDLTRGVTHYPETASIGVNGNAYIFGHSSDYIWKKGSYKTVFALLPHIALGDIILASDSSGKSFAYTVIQTKVAAANDTSVLDQYGNTKKLLTLQTSYPVGTAWKRFVVVAEIKS